MPATRHHHILLLHGLSGLLPQVVRSGNILELLLHLSPLLIGSQCKLFQNDLHCFPPNREIKEPRQL